MRPTTSVSAAVGAVVLVLAFLGGPAPAEAAGPEEAARGVLARLLPGKTEQFVLMAIPRTEGRDVFEIESQAGRIVLRGTDGVAICSALNWYLKYHCHASVSWTGNQLALPEPLPAVEGVIRHVSPHRYRYFLNYCAFSYSFAWWDWPEWERLIDWMALNGINAPLAITGQEATWQAVYRKLGLTDRQIAEFMPGTGYLPFGWMGCLDGWGGPLTQDWIDRHRELQVKILARERELGMKPILQGFTGHVPKALQEHIPGLRLQQTSPWCGFPATYFIDPMDPVFKQVGKAFIEEQTRQFGTDHLYASDTFIEMSPPSSNPEYLQGMGRAVYAAMTAADPEAVWFLQGWIFRNNADFWKAPQAKGLFSGVPQDRLVLIEMTGGTWRKTEAFYGQPWVWATVQEFGGVVSVHGDLPGLMNNLGAAIEQDQSKKLCGVGIIQESLGYNAIFDDLVMEMTWRERPPALEAWVADYTHRRYGRKVAATEQAWAGLLKGPYQRWRASASIVCARPTLERSGVRPSTDPQVGSAELMAALPLLLAGAEELEATDTYRFDLVNVLRQALCFRGWAIHAEIVKAYQAKDRARLTAAGQQLLDLIADMDELLATRHELLLGPWLADAKRWATNDTERRVYEWNARNQLTLWGARDSGLHGYAQKQWAGMMKGFYRPRWERFLERLNQALAAGKQLDMAAWEQEMRDWEEQWTHGTEAYATQPTGDSLAMARRLYAKWFPQEPQ